MCQSNEEDKLRALETAKLLLERSISIQDLYHSYFYYPTGEKTDRNTVERIRKYCSILKELNNLGPLVDCVYHYIIEKKENCKEMR